MKTINNSVAITFGADLLHYGGCYVSPASTAARTSSCSRWRSSGTSTSRTTGASSASRGCSSITASTKTAQPRSSVSPLQPDGGGTRAVSRRSLLLQRAYDPDLPWMPEPFRSAFIPLAAWATSLHSGDGAARNGNRYSWRSMTFGYYVLAALGLAVLMVVHEGGHYLAARRFGMRVVKFSIGFGPDALEAPARKGSPTVYQIAHHPVPRVRPDRGDEPVRGERPQGPRELHERVPLGAHRRPSRRGR